MRCKLPVTIPRGRFLGSRLVVFWVTDGFEFSDDTLVSLVTHVSPCPSLALGPFLLSLHCQCPVCQLPVLFGVFVCVSRLSLLSFFLFLPSFIVHRFMVHRVLSQKVRASRKQTPSPDFPVWLVLLFCFVTGQMPYAAIRLLSAVCRENV